MPSPDSYRLRWKGAITGPFPLARITEMLRTGEISLLHNIEVNGKWTTVRDYFRAAGLTRTHSPTPGFAPPLSPFAQDELPPPIPGPGGEGPRPASVGRRLSPSEMLERSVREGYLWCGATFLLPPIFALLVFPLAWIQGADAYRMTPLATVFTLATLLGSFLPLVFVRRISVTLGQAGLKEEGEAQVKLALILGISGAILWLFMSWWFISNRH